MPTTQRRRPRHEHDPVPRDSKGSLWTLAAQLAAGIEKDDALPEELDRFVTASFRLIDMASTDLAHSIDKMEKQQPSNSR